MKRRVRSWLQWLLHDMANGEVLEDLLEQIEGEIEQVSGDGAYDHRHCYDAVTGREAKPVVPPRKNAVIWQHGNCKAPHHPRDENLQAIRKQGRRRWKEQSNYHRRSLAKMTNFRFKTIFGDRLSAREFDNQAAELFIKCAALNRMTRIAKPGSYKVEG